MNSGKFGTEVTNLNCFWHKCKEMASKFNSDFADKKFKLKKKDDKKQFEKLYPEFDEMGLSGKVIKNHFIQSQKDNAGDSVGMWPKYLENWWSIMMKNSHSNPRQSMLFLLHILQMNMWFLFSIT